ncbi:hypothetical protein [Coleofasciculus sp. FACHB-542]|uniref:hypothetical protein n=1 Tax=Coleofasciculus sp. FACHB-542 TaxID=2692787 RepID=UPI001686C149|nr:hypothetical protein [Coleofasciculus sp. FACHB-542]MBD2088210.1 hypothetical protein [Coleofasciculus sp. FACHB-542]
MGSSIQNSRFDCYSRIDEVSVVQTANTSVAIARVWTSSYPHLSQFAVPESTAGKPSINNQWLKMG